jgi:hypothetical protein
MLESRRAEVTRWGLRGDEKTEAKTGRREERGGVASRRYKRE